MQSQRIFLSFIILRLRWDSSNRSIFNDYSLINLVWWYSLSLSNLIAFANWLLTLQEICSKSCHKMIDRSKALIHLLIVSLRRMIFTENRANLIDLFAFCKRLLLRVYRLWRGLLIISSNWNLQSKQAKLVNESFFQIGNWHLQLSSRVL